MNKEILNSLPFSRTTRFYQEYLNEKQHYKIPVQTLKLVIGSYIFNQHNNKYHVDQVIGHLHRLINRQRDAFFMKGLSINFLLICIRRDLEDDYDRINELPDQTSLIKPEAFATADSEAKI